MTNRVLYSTEKFAVVLRKLLLDGGLNMSNFKQLAIKYFNKLLNEKDISICDKLLASNYVDHDAPGAAPGPESIKKYMMDFLKLYPDMSITVEDVISEESKVVLRNIWNGTNKETGEKFHKVGIVILQFNERNQIEERWSAYTNIN